MKRATAAVVAALWLISIGTSAGSAPEHKAERIQVTLHTLDETGIDKNIGKVKVKQTRHGLVFKPSLTGLSPGLHGFHVHENPSCQPSEDNGATTPGGAAGSHYDPHQSGSHGTPWGEGHLGDLPVLYVDDKGHANTPVLAPRLTLEDLKGRALMVHAGGDNYSDDPKPLGGGGNRVACGVFEDDS